MSLKRVGLILTIFFSIFVLPPVVDSHEEGFTSIDCGGADDFTDPVTNISWTSDMKLPVVGENFTLPQSNNATSPLGYNVTKEMTTVRSFPTGNKNCYELDATTGTKYLLRLSFLYGNFDLQNSGKGYAMKIIIDDTDVLSDVSPTDDINYEFVLTAFSETISVCLGRIEDPPYINSIELRKLDSHMYPTATENKILIVCHRYPSSNGSADIIRYPQDKYDRFWQPWHVRNVAQVHTNKSISDGNSTEKVPSAVMKNAIQTSRISTRLGLTFSGLERVEIEWAFYFAAFEKENKKRGISISGWGSNLHVSVGPFEVPFRNTTSILFKTIYIVSTYSQDYDIAFYKDSESSEPIMLNAWRYCYIYYRSGKKTNQTDFKVMRDIKKYFNITKWTGDPCLPINYTWDGVDCVYDGPSARVSSVDLSYMNLNSTVQDYFTQLDRLRFLNLSNNNLQGDLPDSLFKNHLLKIDWSNNPDLHRKIHGLTPRQRNIVIGTVVPISIIAMVIVFLIWRHVRGKMPEEHTEEEIEEPGTQSSINSAWQVRWLSPVSNNEHTKEEKKKEEHNPVIMQHGE